MQCIYEHAMPVMLHEQKKGRRHAEANGWSTFEALFYLIFQFTLILCTKKHVSPQHYRTMIIMENLRSVCMLGMYN